MREYGYIKKVSYSNAGKWPVLLLTAFLACFLLTGIVKAEDTVEVRLSDTKLIIGDQFDFLVSLTTSPDTRVEFPFPEDGFGDVVIKRLSVSTSNAGNTITHTGTYRLAVYRTGDLLIPSGQLQVRQGALVRNIPYGAVRLSVQEVTGNAGDNGDIRDVKQPMNLPYSRKILVFTIASLIAAAAFVYLMYRLYRKRHRSHNTDVGGVITDPYAYIREKLSAIDPKAYIGEGRYKEFYTLISDLLREFIGLRTTVSALDMTTRELIQALTGTNIPWNVRNNLRERLEESDQVKFARYVPATGQAEGYYTHAMRLLDKINEVTVCPESGDTAVSGTM